jgi:hypothetical protein
LDSGVATTKYILSSFSNGVENKTSSHALASEDCLVYKVWGESRRLNMVLYRTVLPAEGFYYGSIFSISYINAMTYTYL